MTDPIEQACFWLARRPPRAWAELSTAEEADVVIVGAGLTGLWTALFLKAIEPGLAVAIVEQGLAAHGASGRNAGMLSETVDHGHGLAIAHFGMAEALRRIEDQGDLFGPVLEDPRPLAAAAKKLEKLGSDK